MTTIRHSVEATVSRMVLRTLRERAQLAGLPQARSDAPRALAALLDQTITEQVSLDQLQRQAQQAIEAGIGCLVVPLEQAELWVDATAGSGLRIGVATHTREQAEQALRLGVTEIELIVPQTVIGDAEHLETWLGEMLPRSYDPKPVLKLNLTACDHHQILLRACAQAATHDLDLVTVPAGLVADVRRTINSAMGIKVAAVDNLAQARGLLSNGCTRLGTSIAPDLLAAAQLK
ncbi:MAG TPA: hypothetical protein DEF47_16795 [Herpetosiphon sp.]|uniref:Deoxyribose-phosphate aldolase/phospho-2-dehydro-3-deoxyheptonate aldolase n=1 Tax=Herpetosiphon aurantiacus (strain ATCC 23779 / DSM 785 / 114-95) TaxID=316274 RepID=A9B741_HERA2|nr:deoxyribose-phosphate aldolase/phospho-2-dehydro-3-deoxyheptonate aldolase [Herpetosiphon sp.]ABX05909.1 deoxyribose-phosphate aldolase/phospho-2-dehydro-3-deoxyheptonate aldolase [Herpetosiphon aurantiacus DSM 785]HBW51555.1 hypothetical protein [Herpetosiphon sp.]